MTAVMTEDELLANKQAILNRALEREDELVSDQQSRSKRYQYIRPFGEAAEGVLDALVNSHNRFKFGLLEIDTLTRGFGPKELILVTGFSHAGKTQLINTAILNNADKRVLFFSMDDPAEMILLKLVCMHEGISAEELERRVRNGDEEAILMLRQAATRKYGNLFVVDDSLGFRGMEQAIEEATDYWGGAPQCVIIDYLGSIAGDSEAEDGGIKKKVAELKRWIKDKEFPTVVVHQNTRSRGKPGEPITIMSGAFGGEQESTILIGVRRKRDDENLDPAERYHHSDTITVHVVKNKRPPAKITERDGIDFYMDPDTGLIRSQRPGERLLGGAIAREVGGDD